MTDASENLQLGRQIVGNVGMYYACYRLSLLGWNVMPTARNAKGIDIVAYPRDTTNFVGIQVKSLSGKPGVPPIKNLDGVVGDCWVIVNEIGKAQKPTKFQPNCYILRTAKVKELLQQNGPNHQGQYWLAASAYQAKEFHENWKLLDEILNAKCAK